MKYTTLYLFVLLCLYILFPFNVQAQDEVAAEIAFDNALQSFIDKNLLSLGNDAILSERFLIEQMRNLNSEIKSRLTRVDEFREKYFDGLEGRLRELRELKARLRASSSASLNAFIERLENRIEQTIDEGRINYRRQKVFEDGIQLLYVAEEMVNLDPGSSLERNTQIDQRLEQSRQQLLNTFGETTPRGVVTLGEVAETNIFDLFKEWKRTNTIEYELRWTDIQIIKNRLLKNSTALEKERMFKRELRSALMAYNFRNFDFADKLFDEITQRYSFINNLDDIYYFMGESNFNLERYNAAGDIFKKIVKEYPTSVYAAPAYAKLVKIAHHFNEFEQVSEYYRGYETVATTLDPLYDETRFTAALSAIGTKQYEDAVNLLNQITPNSEFYIDARYMLAQAYSGSQNFDEAEQVLLGIVNNYSVQPSYYFNIYLKLGYIKYEKGEFPLALKHFDKIGTNFSLYDRVLMGYSWTYYKMELQKPEDQPRDFSLAKNNLKLLINEYYTSEYFLEAKSLLGYIYQLEQEANSAIRQFDYVFQSRSTKDRSDENIRDRNQVKDLLKDVEAQKEQALIKNNKAEYVIAQNRSHTLQDSLLSLNYSDISANSIAAKNEINRLRAQIEELERLKALALQRNSSILLKRIEELQDQLQDSIEDFPEVKIDPRFGINYFDEHPVARKESVIEDQNKKIISMRNDTRSERLLLNQKLAETEAEITRARDAQQYKRLIHLEIKRDKFKSLLKQYDFLDTYANNMDLSESQINLEKWSDYGAFGIANVNFAVKQAKLERLSYYSEQIGKINQILNSRKSLLDYKIELIEGEVNFMTRKVSQQDRMRERAELDRKFEESYFDTHTSEFEETETVPPVIEKENDQ